MRLPATLAAVLSASVLLAPVFVGAHGTEHHDYEAVAKKMRDAAAKEAAEEQKKEEPTEPAPAVEETDEDDQSSSLPPVPSGGFPIKIEPRFDLVAHTGERVSHESLKGTPLVLFFGYAGCESICDVALPRMAAAVEALGDEGAAIQPLMITVDPEYDTPEALAGR